MERSFMRGMKRSKAFPPGGSERNRAEMKRESSRMESFEDYSTMRYFNQQYQRYKLSLDNLHGQLPAPQTMEPIECDEDDEPFDYRVQSFEPEPIDFSKL